MRATLRRIVAGGLVALSVLALCIAMADRMSVARAAITDRLALNSVLAPGQYIQSANGDFTLVMQGDGNLVLYASGGRALWSTKTQGNPGASFAVQSDSNLVVYSTAAQPLWASSTQGRGGTTLAVQNDGNVVLYTASAHAVWSTGTQQSAPADPPSSTPAPSPPPPAPGPDRVVAGGSLLPGQMIKSSNGNFTLAMQSDGNLVLRSVQGNPLWYSGTYGHPGAFLTVQGDGNVVVYSPTYQPLWNAGAQGRGGDVLAMQSDGNLVLYTPTAQPVWYTGTQVPLGSNDNPDPRGTLKAGNGLSVGSALVSVNGQNVAQLQGDGNFVVYDAGRPTWATNSVGWAGDHLVLQGDGNLVLYSSNYSALWSAATQGTGANQLIIGNDGDLRLYNPPGQVVWQSAGTPWPMLFPPATSPPPTSTSHYLRNLTGNPAIDAPNLRAMGCADANANPAGHSYLVVLHVGAQFSNINGGWGVMLSATSKTLTNASLVAAIKGYIDGYVACMAGYSLLTLAIATNNDSGQYCNDSYCSNPVPPAGVPDPLGAVGGQVWAQQVVNPLATYAASSQITVAGGNDVEPGFNGFVSQALTWTSAFLAATGQPYVFIGSADGCPYRGLGQTGTCNWGWTQAQLYDLAFGLGVPSRMIPMPQIYNTNLAVQWANISNVGVSSGGAPITFGGPLTEVTACQQSGPCYSMGSAAAWTALWSDLNAMPSTRIAGMPYATDLRIN